MPHPKNPVSFLTAADLKALLAEKEIEVLMVRQAELEADGGRVDWSNRQREKPQSRGIVELP